MVKINNNNNQSILNRDINIDGKINNILEIIVE